MELDCWPMRVLLHPLQLGLHTQEIPELGMPHAVYFRNLAARRVEEGDINATMLTILCNTERGRNTTYAIVDLDKNPLVMPQRSANSTRASAVDLYNNPIASTRDDIDEVMEELIRIARLKRKNIWSPGLWREHVQAAIIRL